MAGGGARTRQLHRVVRFVRKNQRRAGLHRQLGGIGLGQFPFLVVTLPQRRDHDARTAAVGGDGSQGFAGFHLNDLVDPPGSFVNRQAGRSLASLGKGTWTTAACVPSALGAEAKAFDVK